MRILAGLLTVCFLSSCYGIQPKIAERIENPKHPAKLPLGAKLALLTTNGQQISPVGPPWQQVGLVRMQELLKAQGLKLTDLAPASGEQDMLSQGFPELVSSDNSKLLAQTAKDQKADLVVLLKQTPKPDLKVDLFTRQMRYTCDVALQVYSPTEKRYLFQIKALGESGYTSLIQSAALIGMLTTIVVVPGIRIGYGTAQQQQSTQAINIVSITAGIAIIGILVWDFIQGPVPAEVRQQQACEQALQEAATGLSKELQASPSKAKS